MCTCRARPSSAAGTSAAVSEPTAPRAVRMARSLPFDRATVIPVGLSPRTATVSVVTPSPASWSSMNWPAASAPTAATSATLRPSRAAATAVIDADPPTTRDMDGTSFSSWPNAGVTSSPRTSTSGLQSPTTTRSIGPPPGAAASGRDNVDSRVLEAGRVLGGDPGVGDQYVDLPGGADPGERAPAYLGAVRGDHHQGRLPGH